MGWFALLGHLRPQPSTRHPDASKRPATAGPSWMPSVGRTPVAWMKGTRAVWRVEVLGGVFKRNLLEGSFLFF